jgi:hypothetical protein
MESVPETHKTSEIELCKLQITQVVGANSVLASKITQKIGYTQPEFDVIWMFEISFF